MLTKDFKYRSSYDIYELLTAHVKDDKQKIYSVIDPQEILDLRQAEANPVSIPGCVKQSYHICFKPDGTVLTKVNICSCEVCLLGEFLECS